MSMCSEALNENRFTVQGSAVDKRGGGWHLKED